MPITKEIVAAKLKQARENAQLTQEEIAEQVGLDRVAVAKIEIAARNVSGAELERFAVALGRNPREFLSTEPLKEDPLMLFRSVALGNTEEHRRQLNQCIALLREARMLERYLGVDEPELPEGYDFVRIRNLGDAVKQGRETAQRERERLGLGYTPIADMADLLVEQGIRAATIPLQEEVSGVFIKDEDLGAAILVNQHSSQVRRRFSYAHEYAHALIDRNEPSKPSSRTNATTLTEARANAFAGEFLVPEAGVRALLDRLEKGEPSRFHQALYSPASQEVQPFEGRSNPELHRITNREVAAIAHTYQVSAEVVIYRLLDMGAIRRPEKDALLEQKDRIRDLIVLLKFHDAEANESEDTDTNDQPYLRKQIIFLAIEALRRDRIGVSRFRDDCIMTGYPTDELLDALGVVCEEE